MGPGAGGLARGACTERQPWLFVCNQVPENLRTSIYLPVSPLFKQRRWARISWQYVIEYRKGVSGLQVVKNVAEQRSSRHRDTSRSRQAEAAVEAAAFAAGAH